MFGNIIKKLFMKYFYYKIKFLFSNKKLKKKMQDVKYYCTSKTNGSYWEFDFSVGTT